MAYAKGESGNLSGRPKGTSNKVTVEKRILFLGVMESQVDNIQDSLDRIREESDEKYIKALTGLLPYFLPKQQETEITINESAKEPSWFGEVMNRESITTTWDEE